MSYFNNSFIKVILIVFYSMIHLDNVYGPTVQECQNDLTSVLNCAKVAITSYIPRRRMPMPRGPMPLPRLLRNLSVSSNENGTPFTSDDEGSTTTSDDDRSYITSDDEGSTNDDRPFNDDEEFNLIGGIPNYIVRYFSNYVQPFISIPGQVSLDYYCKSDDYFEDEDFNKYYLAMHRLFTGDEMRRAAIAVCHKRLEFLREIVMMDLYFKDEHFSTHTLVKMYLRFIAKKITLNDEVQGERKSPIEFCQTFANH